MGDLSDRMCEQDGITSRGNARPVPQNDTPRTDEILRMHHNMTAAGMQCDVVPADFARKLERELIAKIEDNQKAADMIDEWRTRARNAHDAALRWEEIANGLKRELAEARADVERLREGLQHIAAESQNYQHRGDERDHAIFHACMDIAVKTLAASPRGLTRPFVFDLHYLTLNRP